MLVVYLILAISFISLLSLVGGVALLLSKSAYDRSPYLEGLTNFAAGVMLAAVFFELLPEALETIAGIGPNPRYDLLSFAVFLGILLFFFFERFVIWYHHHDGGHGYAPALYLILVGDGIHNFIDGFTIAVAFTLSIEAGIFTVLATAVHELPQEIADFSIMLKSGLSGKMALVYNFGSALTAYLGAGFGYLFLMQVPSSFSGYALAFGAGMFIYIACSDLIPDLHKEYSATQSKTPVIWFVFGLSLIFVLGHVVAF